MYGLEVLESMNNREMDKYHKEQRRKKDLVKIAINNGIREYLEQGRKHIENIDLLFDCLNAEADKLDFENQESL